jgi:hypothetical protein
MLITERHQANSRSLDGAAVAADMEVYSIKIDVFHSFETPTFNEFAVELFGKLTWFFSQLH